jgi:hypothetical protein
MEMAKKEELAQLMAPTDIIQPKVPFGVDPKTVLCAFFKAGRCQKGENLIILSPLVFLIRSLCLSTY